MNPERWERLKDIFSVVAAGSATTAAEALSKACEGDEDARALLEPVVGEHFRLVSKCEPSRQEMTEGSTAGMLLADRFLLQLRLGSGTFGDVYRAFDRQTGTELAVKVLRNPTALALEYFKREF